jgi:hypothetical protein
MRNIRNWYKLLEGTGLVANDSGPGLAHGTLTANVTWLPFYSPPFSTINVTGTLSPDATGDYTLAGIYNSKPYWKRTTAYHIWWDDPNGCWVISVLLGTPGSAYWNNDTGNVIATYDPVDAATGQASTACDYSLPYDQKGVIITNSLSNISSAAALAFPQTAGSIEMLVRPYWNNADSLKHTLWSTAGGNAKQFILLKDSDNKTYLYTQTTSRGSFTYAWTAHQLYHVVLNWGTNTLYINKVLAKTYNAGDLGTGASTLYIGDYVTTANFAFNGIIYYFIARDVALTLAEITEFYNFFTPLYIPQPT